MTWRQFIHRSKPLTLRLRLFRKIEICSDPEQVGGAMRAAMDDGYHMVVGWTLPDRSATEIWGRRW